MLSKQWLSRFDERQQRLIRNCVNHANDDPAGLPGHNLIMIVNGMAMLLDELTAVNFAAGEARAHGE